MPKVECYSYFSIHSAREVAQLAATPGGQNFSPTGVAAALQHIRATYGETNFDCVAITAALGIQPRRAWHQGEPSGLPDGRPYRLSSWSGCMQTEPTLDAGEQCLHIVRQLQGKIDTLNALRQQYDLQFTLQIVPTMNPDDSTPALYFDREIIDFCYRTGTEIDVDVYVTD